MTTFDAIVLGIVEGLTEFLPISSTAHLILVAEALGLAPSEFLKTFEIAIQFGAILAVVVLFRRTVFHNFFISKRLLVAFLPTALIGAFFYPVVKNVFLANPQISIWALLIGGGLIIALERWLRGQEAPIKELTAIDYRRAFVIGLCQSLAIVPGVSRAAATIFGGRLLGLERRVIVEFSFLLAVPTMFAAAGLDLIQSAEIFSANDYVNLIIGLIVSFLAAMVGIKFLLKLIERHDLTIFGVYRIILALIFLWLW